MPAKPRLPERDPESPGPHWIKQGMQLPRDLGKVFKAAGAAYGSGGVKNLGTAAVALILGMPPNARKAILTYCIQKQWDDKPNEITPEGAWAAFLDGLKPDRGESPKDQGPRYEVRLMEPRPKKKAG